MKIECPACKLSGNIDDSTVPATGLAMTCPRCKKPFTAERPALQSGAAAAMLDTCPVCQYSTFSEEKFALCPKCGLVVADHLKKMLASRQSQNSKTSSPSPARQVQETDRAPLPRLTPEQQAKEEASLKKYGLDRVPGVAEVEKQAVNRPARETPLPVLIAGWGTIIVSIIVMIYGGTGINDYLLKTREAKAAAEALEEAASGGILVFQFLLFPALSVIFSIVMLIFGTQFLAMKKWSIMAMHKGAWTGLFLLVLMKITDMIFWCKRASADASIGYYAMGLMGDLLMLVLYAAPFLALAEYLMSPLFEESEELFF